MLLNYDTLDPWAVAASLGDPGSLRTVGLMDASICNRSGGLHGADKDKSDDGDDVSVMTATTEGITMTRMMMMMMMIMMMIVVQ